MVEKWRDERGETLIEVLASILVMALSILMLFGAVIASSRINKSAKGADDKYYEILNAAEKQESAAADVFIAGPPPAPESVVTVTQKKPDTVNPTGNPAGTPVGTPIKVKVNFYGGEGALSYKYKPTTPAGP